MYNYEEVCKGCINQSEAMCMTCDGGYHKQVEELTDAADKQRQESK